MSGYWLINLTRGKLTEEQLRFIPCPKLELVAHATTKVTQGSSIIAGCLIAPLVSLARRDPDLKTLLDRCYKYGKSAFLFGLIFGPCITVVRSLSLETEQVYDLCYLIRSNTVQIQIDRQSYLGALLGLGLAKYYGLEFGKGALFGYCGGYLAGNALNALHYLVHSISTMN